VSALRSSVPRAMDRALAKALAKTPADRFATTAEFAAALTAALAVPEAEPAEAVRVAGRPRPRFRQAGLVAAVLAVLTGALVLALGPGRSLWQRGPAHPARPFYVVLSEFEGPPDDPILTASVQDLVQATVDASGVVAVLPRDQIRYTLRRAGKPDTLRITGDLAREIAVRNGVRAVLDGSVRRVGEGYALVLRVANPDSGATTVTVTGKAKDADALIPQTTRLATRLLEGMKRRQTEIAAYRFSPRPPATSSFEAYRKIVEGRRAWARFDYATARQMYHEALALDPEYANAWVSLGILNQNDGKADSARFCLEEALRHPERAATEERLWWQASLAAVKDDIPGALDAYGRLIDMGRLATNSYINRGALFATIGRFDESLADCDSATARTPKGMNQLLIYNRCEVLLRLGRVNEAREALESLKGRWRKDKEQEWPFWAGEWGRAESVAVAMLEDPASGTAERVCGRWGLVGVQASRGQVTRAFRSLEQLPPEARDYTVLGSVCLARLSGRPAGIPPGLLSDTSHVDTLARAFALAWQHDPAGAERLLRLRATRKLPLPTMVEPFPRLVRAVVAEDRQRWDEVVALLAPLARQDWVYGDEWLAHVRWTVATAFERMGRPDSAAAYFELALKPDRLYWWERVSVRMASPFTHQRLVMLYVRLGRLPEAGRHLTALEQEFSDPDPDMRRLLSEARSAVMAARGMARPERSRS
jgi:tetratricopeptide (TPR) repeat protein